MSDWADVERGLNELREEADVIAMTNWRVTAAVAWERMQNRNLNPGASWSGARRLAQIHEALGGRW